MLPRLRAELNWKKSSCNNNFIAICLKCSVLIVSRYITSQEIFIFFWISFYFLCWLQFKQAIYVKYHPFCWILDSISRYLWTASRHRICLNDPTWVSKFSFFPNCRESLRIFSFMLRPQPYLYNSLPPPSFFISLACPCYLIITRVKMPTLSFSRRN